MKMTHLLFFATIGIFKISVAQQSPDLLARRLWDAGFENVRVQQKANVVLVALENNVYRWDIDAITTALDTIAAFSGTKKITLCLLKHDIPQIWAEITAGLWEEFRKGGCSEIDLREQLKICREPVPGWDELKKCPAYNPGFYKTDIVPYPQLSIQNRLLTQLYEVQFNIAPAIEIVLWKGMMFTGQVIFPVRNDVEILNIKENVDYKERNFLYTTDEGHHIRPGFVTLSQDFRLPKQWFGNISIGQFNAYKYGANFYLNHYFKDGRWSLSFNSGLTGKAHFIDNQWITGKIDNLTWKLGAGYFYPGYNMLFQLSYGCYLNQDKGFRADCTRYFGETVVGFYAMHTGEKFNGGFRFTIPVPTAKRKRGRMFRISPPRYFDSDYNAGYAVYYGKDFETRPNENQAEHFRNTEYIKNQILRQKINH